MSGPVLDFDPQSSVRRDKGPGDTREAPGVLDTIAASARVTFDENRQAQQLRLNDAYQPVVDALVERNGGRERDFMPSLLQSLNPITGRGRYDGDTVWRSIKAAREADPEAFADLPKSQQEFERSVLRRDGQRTIDQDIASRGNGAASFAGAVGGELADPVNLITLGVGGIGKSVGARVLTEGLIGASVELAQTPQRGIAREALGEGLTAEEAALNIAAAGVGAAVLRGGVELAPTAAGKAVRVIDPNWDERQIGRAFAKQVPATLRTPEEEAALFVVNRQVQIEDASPFVRTHEAIDAHVGKMQAALDALDEGRVASASEIAAAGTSHAPTSSPLRPAVSAVARSLDFDTIKAAIRGPESGGNDRADNALGSSAAGRYQFIESTFISLYRREYGVSDGAAQRAWNGNRYDVEIQERLMDRLLSDNAGRLERAGIPPDAGNLYIAHFAGAGKAIELIQAPRDAPVSDFFSPTAIRQNPTYLGGGKTVGEALDIIRGKVGDPSVRSPAQLGPDNPPLRDPPADEVRPSARLAPNPKLPDEVNALLDPVADIVATPGRSLNKLDQLAEDLGSKPVAVRDALQELVDRGELAQNRRTGAFIRKPSKRRDLAIESEPSPAAQRPIGDEVQKGLSRRGFKQSGDTFSRRIEGFAEAGTLSDGGRVVTLRLDERQRYLERVDGFGNVDADIDLRRFNDPDDAIEAVLSGRTEPRANAEAVQAEFDFPPRGSDAATDLVQGVRPRADHGDPPAELDPRFEEPDSEGIRAIGDSVWHDLEAIPPNDIARFDLGDGRGERSAAQIREEIDAEQSAVEAIRSCLK